ncbi:13542_t:CDS:2 [Racocetra persica]|uniref:13542_t:CDS:1 n=1 Tax=Racocetra persica TaxID=160502 RepID=A0ACA9LBS7_9GLOM|nr:13542_t:CDS:2 [Racocetra persica]
MGGSQSSAKGYGYHILRVKENSPAHTAGIEPFFDYIVGINGIPLDTETSVLQEQLLFNVDKEVILLVYSTKEQEYREVSLIPNKTWTTNSEDGLIGCSIRYCSYEVPSTDYVIGTPHEALRNENDFYELIEAHLGKPLRLYVYNADFDVCREVIIVPNHEWGGEGSLGCGVGYGIPKTNKFKSRERNFELSWNSSTYPLLHPSSEQPSSTIASAFNLDEEASENEKHTYSNQPDDSTPAEVVKEVRNQSDGYNEQIINDDQVSIKSISNGDESESIVIVEKEN